MDGICNVRSCLFHILCWFQENVILIVCKLRKSKPLLSMEAANVQILEILNHVLEVVVVSFFFEILKILVA